MPILDGHKVDADQIDAAKHRYIGTWRPPQPPPWRELGDSCPCGLGHFYTDLDQAGGNERTAWEHWQRGCFDEPQYVTIKEGE